MSGVPFGASKWMMLPLAVTQYRREASSKPEVKVNEHLAVEKRLWATASRAVFFLNLAVASCCVLTLLAFGVSAKVNAEYEYGDSQDKLVHRMISLKIL